MKVCLTVDMEHDCPPYLTGYRGIEQGAPRLMELFDQEQIAATFFTTGDVARRYPSTIEAIVAAGHELGCHGDSHRRFDDMDLETAQEEISRSTATLREFYPVVSFRAPNLRLPNHYLSLLENEAYRLDSSEALYKARARPGRHKTSVRRFPASVTSSILRLPRWLRNTYLSRLTSPVVLFVHPWEFVDLRRERLRIDCRFRTGDKALDCLQECIEFFRHKAADFVRMQDLLN